MKFLAFFKKLLAPWLLLKDMPPSGAFDTVKIFNRVKVSASLPKRKYRELFKNYMKDMERHFYKDMAVDPSAITIIRTIRTNRGYHIQHYRYADGSCGDRVFRRALTPNGAYIGSPKVAIRLCVKRGIIPMLRNPTSKVCSIGFSPTKRLWYGWSHRAIFGFRPGMVAKKGDAIGVKPGTRCKDWNMARQWAERFAESVS